MWNHKKYLMYMERLKCYSKLSSRILKICWLLFSSVYNIYSKFIMYYTVAFVYYFGQPDHGVVVPGVQVVYPGTLYILIYKGLQSYRVHSTYWSSKDYRVIGYNSTYWSTKDYRVIGSLYTDLQRITNL